MYLGQYSSAPLRYILLIILYYVSKCTCLNTISKIKSELNFNNTSALDLNIFSGLGNLTNLPKNCALDPDEISKNAELYLAGQQNEDIYLNGTQLIKKYGYKVEEHHVTTSDGYNLALYRIPSNGRIVFIMHGIECSFIDWLTVGPDQGLPYLLAAEGYDVWMGNARGNIYSRKNDHLDRSDSRFWNFSFNEIGSIDLPAMIDYILLMTGKVKLTYLGHSQGTTSFFVLCSTKPEYNKKIDFMVALSAVAWMKHMASPIIRFAASHHGIINMLGRAFGLNEILPDNDLKKALILTLCGDTFFATIICQNLLFLFAGFNYDQVNYKQSPVIFNHNPAGASIMQFEHYFQLIVSGDFRNYDHGLIVNLEKYGSTTPPVYPIDKITVPIAIFHSQGDWLASTIDVDNLRSKLQNVAEYYEIPLHSFNHVDYLFAKDIKKLVYDRVLTLIKQHCFD